MTDNYYKFLMNGEDKKPGIYSLRIGTYVQILMTQKKLFLTTISFTNYKTECIHPTTGDHIVSDS